MNATRNFGVTIQQLWCIAALLLAAGGALAQPLRDGADAPYLMIDADGHTSTVRALAFSKDGHTLYSGGDDKVVRVWDWQKGETTRMIHVPAGEGHYGRIYALALSPDESLLAVAADVRDRCGEADCPYIRLYEAATGKFLRAFTGGHDSQVLSLAFSKDGSRLLSPGLDAKAILWDVAGGKPIHALVGHRDNIYRAAFTTDGRRVVTASDDATLRLWNARDGQLITEMTGHAMQVFRLAISPRGDLIASASDDGEIRLWDQRTGAFLRTLVKIQNSIGSLTFDGNGEVLVAGIVIHSDVVEAPTAYRVEDGAKLAVYQRQQEKAVGIARMTPLDDVIATGDKSGEIHFWNIRTGATDRVLKGGGQTVWAVDIGPGSHTIGWGRVWERETAPARGPITYSMELPRGPWWWRTPLGAPSIASYRVRHHALTTEIKDQNGDSLTLSGRRGGEHQFRNALLDVNRNSEEALTITRQSSDGFRHTSYGFAPDHRHILSGGDNGWLTRYRLDGNKDGDYVGHDGTIWSLAADGETRLLVSGGDDQTVRLWNLETRELIVSLFQGEGDWVMWTPQGYYTGSREAGRMVGWLVDIHRGNTPRFYYADELPELKRRDIVEAAIEKGSALAAIETAAKHDPTVRRTFADLIQEKLGMNLEKK